MCEHKRLRCTNCVLYCLDCGAKVDTPPELPKAETAEQAKPKQRKTRRKDESNG